NLQIRDALRGIVHGDRNELSRVSVRRIDQFHAPCTAVIYRKTINGIGRIRRNIESEGLWTSREIASVCYIQIRVNQLYAAQHARRINWPGCLYANCVAKAERIRSYCAWAIGGRSIGRQVRCIDD